MKVVYTTFSIFPDFQHPKPELDPLPQQAPQSSTERTERLEQMFITQQQSLSQLTEAIATLVTTLNQSSQHPFPSRITTSSKPTAHPPQPSTDTPEAVTDTQAASSPGTVLSSPSSSKSSSRTTTSIAKVNRAIEAIMHYNNETATTKKDKWLVAISALKQLTKCNQDLIKRVIESRHSEIEAHHAQNELGKFQNSKGKLAPSITEVIQLD